MEQTDSNEIKSGGEAEPSSTSHGPPNSELNPSREEIEDHVPSGKLFKDIRKKYWKSVEDFIRLNPTALTAEIKGYEIETAFRLITRELRGPSQLIKKIVSVIHPDALEQLDENDQSALFLASLYGNRQAAEAFVDRNYRLPNKRNRAGLLPIHTAAKYGHKETFQYLLEVTTDPLDDDNGVQLLKDLITSGQYGAAFDLLKKYPDLVSQTEDRGRILEALANKPLAFASGSQLGYLQQLIYHCIPVQVEHIHYPGSVVRDAENQYENSKNSKRFSSFGSIRRQICTAFAVVRMKLHPMLWHAIITLVPGIKFIRDTKLMHKQAVEIVRLMCHEGVIWSTKEALESLRAPILTAARLGIYEIVREILDAYYYSYCFWDENGHAIFHLAIIHRQDKVFSLLNKLDLFLRFWKTASNSENTDNILHLTGRLVPSTKVSGAALQMQRELQWFKAVETYVHPSLQEQRDESNKTPREVFTEQHEKLVEKGEKWMKETATSCTIAVALIVTVVFAAAFTVPGGNDNDGIPIFLNKIPFTIFVVSDALALFASTASLLMFLGILTSRYSENDFLVSLPTKLIIGLITMFFSIASMMVAFGATVYIILSHPWKWTIIPVSLIGCLPVTLFAMLQLPLLVEVFSSTYGRSIFH